MSRSRRFASEYALKPSRERRIYGDQDPTRDWKPEPLRPVQSARGSAESIVSPDAHPDRRAGRAALSGATEAGGLFVDDEVAVIPASVTIGPKVAQTIFNAAFRAGAIQKSGAAQAPEAA